MARVDFGRMHCSIARALDVVGDTWAPLVLRDIYLGIVRFDALATDLGVSRNLLTQRLERLVAAGVVERHAYQQNPPRYDYALTEAGRDLMPILMALTAWGDRWVGPEAGPPILFRHDACGEVVAPTVACPACGEPMTADGTSTLAGPGAGVGPGTALLGQGAGTVGHPEG